MGKMFFVGLRRYLCSSRAEWTRQSKRRFDNSVWSAFNQVKVDCRNMKVLSAHSQHGEDSSSHTDFVVTLVVLWWCFFLF